MEREADGGENRKGPPNSHTPSPHPSWSGWAPVSDSLMRVRVDWLMTS